MNEAHDEKLTRGFRSVDDADAARDDCPPAATMLDAATGTLGREEADRVLEHLASCSLCTEAWRLAQAVESVPASVSRPSPIRWSAVAAAAAGLVLVVGFWPREEPSAIRGEEPEVCTSVEARRVGDGLLVEGIPEGTPFRAVVAAGEGSGGAPIVTIESRIEPLIALTEDERQALGARDTWTMWLTFDDPASLESMRCDDDFGW